MVNRIVEKLKIINMKNILVFLIICITLAGCKYDDSYFDPKLDKTICYFASEKNYTRTVVVGEGLRFKIGAAMAGASSNDKERKVDFRIMGGTLPTNYFNYSSLMNNGKITATIPAGEILGYFPVIFDSAKFLNDPVSLKGTYTIPVKIIGTSLDSIGADSINISVKYMAKVDGFYLYESVIKREINGIILQSKTRTEKSVGEGDSYTWKLTTIAPFTVEAVSAISAFTTSLKFLLTVSGNSVSFGQPVGSPIITPEGENTYYPLTRDFVLNYQFKKPGNDTLYHVSQKLIFRNRLRDGINEPRDYLNSLNK
jgi:hypothetical protein